LAGRAFPVVGAGLEKAAEAAEHLPISATIAPETKQKRKNLRLDHEHIPATFETSPHAHLGSTPLKKSLLAGNPSRQNQA